VQLVLTERHEKQKIVELITASALRGPLCIIAGSEWIPSYSVAHSIRRSTVEVERVLSHVRLARAFTCYQLLDLLAATRGDGTPILSLDFLHTFFSPDIPLPVRVRTLRGCCHHLQRLSLHQPVTVFAVQEADRDSELFCALIASSADEVLQLAADEATVWQPALF
jgi:hypothetical protein